MSNFSEESRCAKLSQLTTEDAVGTTKAAIDEFQQNMDKLLLVAAMLTGNPRLVAAALLNEITDALDRIATNAILADMSKAEPRQ